MPVNRPILSEKRFNKMIATLDNVIKYYVFEDIRHIFPDDRVYNTLHDTIMNELVDKGN